MSHLNRIYALQNNILSGVGLELGLQPNVSHLRVERYTSGSICGIDQPPPPTSSCIRDHIHRAAYLVHAACSLVSNRPGANAGLREHGWIEQSGTMLPCKSLKPLPPQVLSTCGCGGTCDTNKCKRYANGVKYEMFCPGKTADSLCKNNHGERELFLR